MDATDYSLLSRINRDIPDGLIVLDTAGTIVYVNPAAGRLLGTQLQIGTKYAALLAAEPNGQNDAFHQYLLDSVYDKAHRHSGDLAYTRPDGSVRTFQMVSSFLFGEDGSSQQGVVIQFSDITEVHRVRKLHQDTVFLFVSLLGMLSIFTFASVIWMNTGEPFPSALMTVFIEITGVVLAYFLFRSSPITWKDLGLSVHGCGRYLLIDGAATAAILGIMLVVKMVLRRTGILSAGEPFFHWELWTTASTLYPITVVLQEFLTRSLVHESITRVIPSKHAELYAIAISSLFFGAIHLYLGLAFMAGAAFLLGFFGLIYTRQRCIWGLCIPHYILGLSVSILWGF